MHKHNAASVEQERTQPQAAGCVRVVPEPAGKLLLLLSCSEPPGPFAGDALHTKKKKKKKLTEL